MTPADLAALVARHWLRDGIRSYLVGLSQPPALAALQNLGATAVEAGQIVANWKPPPAQAALNPTNAAARLSVLADAIARADGNPAPLTSAGLSEATAFELITAINRARPS